MIPHYPAWQRRMKHRRDVMAQKIFLTVVAASFFSLAVTGAIL